MLKSLGSKFTFLAGAAMLAAGIGSLAYSQGFTFTAQVGSAGQPSIAFTNDATSGFYSPAAGTIAAASGGTDKLRVTSLGTQIVGNNQPFTIASTIPLGSVAYGSLGTNTTLVAGTIYWAEAWAPVNATVTGVKVLAGATATTDNWVCGLWNSAGTLVANAALTGALVAGGANTIQTQAFTATYALVGPARYWIGCQSNGTTATMRTVAASTFVLRTTSTTGAFGTLPTLTPPTTFTADVGPVAFLY